MTDSIDALIEKPWEHSKAELADALESTADELRRTRLLLDEAKNANTTLSEFSRVAQAELRQERELTASLAQLVDRDTEAELARARGVIEKVRALPRYEINALSSAVDAYDIEGVLDIYDYDKV